MLVRLHWLESLAQICALLLLYQVFHLAIPYTSLALVVSGFLAWNLVSLWFVRDLQPEHGERHVCLQLVAEVISLGLLLYFTGGATNPFVSLFLVPLAIGAITLRFSIALPLALLCVAAYTSLLFFYMPLAAQHHMGDSNPFSLHVLGMWITFMVSATVVLTALSWLASLARARATNIASLREEIIATGQIAAIGGIAAGAAHSLSTPLSTVAILLEDLLEELQEDDTEPNSPGDPLTEKIQLAREQIGLCRERLADILSTAGAYRAGTAPKQAVNLYMARLLMQWRLSRPASTVTLEDCPNTQMEIDPALEYTLTTLLDNAADANGPQTSTKGIWVRARAENGYITIEVEDEGGGPLPQPGMPSSKQHGAGAGLLIARANLRRSGGELKFQMGQRGCIAQVLLPVTSTREEG